MRMNGKERLVKKFHPGMDPGGKEGSANKMA
jgi:hypothetical protein